MTDHNYLFLVPLLPLLGFLLLGLFGKQYFSKTAGNIATTILLLTTGLSVFAAYEYFFVNGLQNGVYPTTVVNDFTWLRFTDALSIDMGLILDPISMLLILVVSFISLMVHLFSMGYMKGEKRVATYYAFLGLFTTSMLGLVLSSNIFQIFIFWELVGVSSFLLIGFYYDKPSAVAASKKAFIITRFADLGFLIGILILGLYCNTLDFGLMIEKLTSATSPEYLAITSGSFLGLSALTWALALVFMGGAGKSAMFPLHIWLPDAMEGPTPVSALIHAATMVVAGVYLVARLFPVFAADQIAMSLVTWTGMLSALIAAIIACTQTDIKRVLAYSTMSQIGYMMFALGIAAEDPQGYTASMFHLFTHAFFKSLLFLAAGAIIHLVHSNELKDMGGLRKLAPVTHAAFLIACLAIAGIPPFAGFFSKELILHAAYQSNRAIFYLSIFTAMLTAFYMFRLYFSIFWRKPANQALHGEGPLTMKLPLVVLSVCTVAAGFIPFSEYITASGSPVPMHTDLLFSIAPVALAVLAILMAAYLYKNENERSANVVRSLGWVHKLAAKKFYVDEAYIFFTKKIVFNLVGRPAAWFDRNIVDGTMNGIAFVTASTSRAIRGLQSGKVQQYALHFFAGVALLAVLFIYLWK